MNDKEARKILGVGASTDADGIRQASRRSAMRHHPDRNDGDAGSEEKFKEVQQAYERLSAGESEDSDGFEPAYATGGDPFADLFGAIFGNMRGASLSAEIPLETAVRGGSVTVGRSALRSDAPIALNIPAGTLDGSLMEVRVGGRAQIVQIRVQPPRGWEIDGGVLRKAIMLNLLDQLVGAKVQVDVPLVGPVNFEVPRNLASGAAFKVEHPALRPYRVVLALDFSSEMQLNDTELDLLRSARSSYERRKS